MGGWNAARPLPALSGRLADRDSNTTKQRFPSPCMASSPSTGYWRQRTFKGLPSTLHPPLTSQLVACTPGAEALARTPIPILSPLLAALGWGVAGQVLALETLLRALGPASRSRDLLVGAAVARGLPRALLARLEDRLETADQVRGWGAPDGGMQGPTRELGCGRLLGRRSWTLFSRLLAESLHPIRLLCPRLCRQKSHFVGCASGSGGDHRRPACPCEAGPARSCNGSRAGAFR